MTKTSLTNAVAGVLLSAGFVYSGIATLREYRAIFAAPPTAGADGAIDAHVAALQIASAADLRAAVTHAGWTSHADVSLVTDISSALTVQDAARAQFTLGYLLYPTRLWRRSAHDAAAAAADRGQRQVIVLGATNPFPHARVHAVSPLLYLVELP